MENKLCCFLAKENTMIFFEYIFDVLIEFHIKAELRLFCQWRNVTQQQKLLRNASDWKITEANSKCTP